MIANVGQTQENGVDNAIQFIYSKLEYARSISTEKSKGRKPMAGTATADSTGVSESTNGADLYESDVEESWTLVAGDDFDPEILKKEVIHQTEPSALADKGKPAGAVAS